MDLHPILDQHDSIAWDMDKTLVNGPNSHLFRLYIALTPHKKHYVVTFRNKLWAATILEELETHGMKNVRDRIVSVEDCPELVHYCYMVRDGVTRFTAESFCKLNSLTPNEFNVHADRFPMWKAERAKELGCTILVDDMPEWVLAGCEHHGIAFHDSLSHHDMAQLGVALTR